jgi:CRP-like cAMP-binding protein
MSISGALQPVVRKLEALSRLDAEDRAALTALPTTITKPRAGSRLITEGKPADCFYALLGGFAYRTKSTADGRSQIVSFHVPGDLFDLALLLNEHGDTSVVTMGATTVAAIQLDALRELKDTRPNIADALWRDTLLDAAIHKEWVVNIGQRDAPKRIAHMLAEFVVRRAAALPNQAARFEVPLNQQHIAAATGLTSVHVNRTLKLLEGQGALTSYAGHVVMDDQAALQRIAGFEPGYLHPVALGQQSGGSGAPR